MTKIEKLMSCDIDYKKLRDWKIMTTLQEALEAKPEFHGLKLEVVVFSSD